MTLRLMESTIPSLRGKEFSQNVILYTVLMTSWCGYASKGNWLAIAYTISLKVLMYVSIVATCSFLPVMLMFIAMLEKNF